MRNLRVLLCLGVLAGLAACQQSTAPPAAVPVVAEPEPGFSVIEADIDQIQQALQNGTLSSRELVQAYLDRIAAIDVAGPSLHAVIELNPDALGEADQRDAERRQNHLRGPLHGIAVLLKDNIDATPMINSAGSLALADNRPPDDAFVVARLRAAGAVILGKTNLSEWANFRSTHSASGWSARGGQTRNPYVLDRSPCGSSAGTGTAIAASLASVGIGTETDGSVICPSAVNGLVGIKPTVGLVSRDGIIPISASQDTAGAMARNVTDAAVLLGAMAGSDPADPATAAADQRGSSDYRAHLKPDALRGARIGVVRASMGFHPAVDAVMEQAIAQLRAAGAQVLDATIPTQGQWDDPEFSVLLYEFKDGMARYLAGSNVAHKSLADLIAFNSAHADVEMPWFGQEIFTMAEGKGPLSDAAYVKARDDARRLAGAEGIDAALAAQQLDALLAPATGPAWPVDPVNGDHFLGAGYGAAAVAGYPSITVPAGAVHGLPVGVVFLGPAWSEGRLIELAYGYEQASHARKPPAYRPTL
ncbi:MAG: amidase [Lysobacterales bacterium CG17_big_fil_post_rev_8_21_14_2_50_64_11]|nr:MAG: amidase [Xanthomonadales bacterium CG17_big_fil_post_rev_8_21_14_2_50_64_11]PIX61588.1 MAG: amidase [Xanthomonadales bacterium CG_4_10_14_3_um_filter_64_11]